MQYLVVLDTNVIVSALLSKHPDAATVQVFHAMLTDSITPVYNDEILTEYSDVLHRQKFHFPETTIQATINYIIKYGIYTDRLSTGEDLPVLKELSKIVFKSKDKPPRLVKSLGGYCPSDTMAY